MDILAHTLWTNAVFYAKYAKQRRQRYWAAFFGVAPDFVAFTPVFIYGIFVGLVQGQDFGDRGSWESPYMNPTGIYAFTMQAYNYTHSIVVFAIAFLAIWAARRGQPYWPMLGWALHIVIDLFTHPDFFHTPLLYPISDFKNTEGVSWGHPVFMAINYSLLVIVYILLTLYQRRQRKSHAEKE